MSKLSYEFLMKVVRASKTQEDDTYITSPLYHLLTGRRGAWVYQGYDSSVIVSAHPNVQDRLLIFPEFGAASYQLTANLLTQVSIPKQGIQCARYSGDNIDKLKQQIQNLKFTPVSNIRVQEETVLDWRYPVRILDTQIVAGLQGSSLKNIRKEFNAASQTLTTMPLNTNDAPRMMQAALKFWEGSMIANGKDTPDMSEYYEALFACLKENPDAIDGFISMSGKWPVGMMAWDKPHNNAATSILNLNDNMVRGLSEFQIVSACRKLSTQGVSYLNRGGSEREGLDRFKMKFNPVKSVDILSAEVIFHKPSNDNIQATQLVDPITNMHIPTGGPALSLG